MKSKLIVLLCFAVIFATGIDAQNDSKAILLDEHSSLPCDDLIGRLDMFFYELSKDASSTGLVVISTSNEKKWWAVFREYLIDAHARDRNFKPNRIKYVRTIESDEFMVQLWQIPLGVAEPAVQNVDITYKTPTRYQAVQARSRVSLRRRDLSGSRGFSYLRSVYERQSRLARQYCRSRPNCRESSTPGRKDSTGFPATIRDSVVTTPFFPPKCLTV